MNDSFLSNLRVCKLKFDAFFDTISSVRTLEILSKSIYILEEI